MRTVHSEVSRSNTAAPFLPTAQSPRPQHPRARHKNTGSLCTVSRRALRSAARVLRHSLREQEHGRRGGALSAGFACHRISPSCMRGKQVAVCGWNALMSMAAAVILRRWQ